MAIAMVVAMAGAVTSAAAYTKFRGRPEPIYNGLTPYTKHVLPKQRADLDCDKVVNPGDQARLGNAIPTVTLPAGEYLTPCPEIAYEKTPGTNIPAGRFDINGDGVLNPGDQALDASVVSATSGLGKFRDKTKQPFNEYSHWNTPLSLDATYVAIDFWDFFDGHTGPASYDLDYFVVASSSDPLFDCPVDGVDGCSRDAAATGNVYATGAYSGPRCEHTNPQTANHVRTYFPTGVMIPDVSGATGQFNSALAVLQPDGETLVELNAACHKTTMGEELSLYGEQTGEPNYQDPAGCPTPTSSPTRTPTPTGTLTPTWTRTPTDTPTATNTPGGPTSTPTPTTTPYCHRQYPGEVQSIYGLDYRHDGTGPGGGGGHTGSGLSAIGGTIRKGELLATGSIKHALKVNIARPAYCNPTVRAGSEAIDGEGFRWPAIRRDSLDTTYGGGIDGLQMGSLIALPCDNAPESNICGLTADNIAAPSERVPDGCDSAPGLKTAVARKLFKAFQDWGAYVADNGDPPAIDVEGGNGDGVPDEVLTAYGINMIASYSDTGATHDYYCDWWRIWVNLALVSNNDSTHVGGSAAQSGTSGADNFHHNPTPANDIKRPAPLGN